MVGGKDKETIALAYELEDNIRKVVAEGYGTAKGMRIYIQRELYLRFLDSPYLHGMVSFRNTTDKYPLFMEYRLIPADLFDEKWDIVI